LKVTEADRAMLESWLRAPTLAQGLALRARVILASADGEGVRPMARRLGVSPDTVAVWRRCFRSEELSGLRTKARAGRPRRITSAKSTRLSARRCASPRRRPIGCAVAGQRGQAVVGQGPSHLAEVRAAAAPGGELQVQPRLRVRREAGRHRRALSGLPARALVLSVEEKVPDLGA
jgi:transposase-like protein